MVVTSDFIAEGIYDPIKALLLLFDRVPRHLREGGTASHCQFSLLDIGDGPEDRGVEVVKRATFYYTKA
jgi:hypothetical protein